MGRCGSAELIFQFKPIGFLRQLPLVKPQELAIQQIIPLCWQA
jgi:hypothetical protein